MSEHDDDYSSTHRAGGNDFEAEDARTRYDMFWKLDLMISGIGPDDVSPQMIDGLVKAFREEAHREMNSSTSETISERDIEWLSKATTVTPKWEDTWQQFKDGIRRERIRLGIQLGVESEIDPDHID